MLRLFALAALLSTSVRPNDRVDVFPQQDVLAWDGIADGVDENGDPKKVPVSQCGGKCAYRGTCLKTIEECY